MVGTENHLLEGNYEDKTFAPGYGEFASGVGANLEALALAVPTDAQPGGVPPELGGRLARRGRRSSPPPTAVTGAGDASLDAMTAAWEAHRATGTVPRCWTCRWARHSTQFAATALMPAVDDRNPRVPATRRSTSRWPPLDLELQYRPPAEVDLGRLNVWANQLALDSASDEADAGHRPAT